MQDAAQTLIAPPASVVVSSRTETRPKNRYAFVGIAFIALCLKAIIAYTTLGTNDSVTFYTFARSLSEHGLKWTYERGVAWLPKGPIFNHPPMTAWFLRFIYHLSHQAFFQTNGLSFPFLLRLPGILSDFIVVLALL